MTAGSSALDRSFERGDTLPSDLLDMFSRPEWWQRAECRGMSPSIFFPNHGDRPAAALEICGRCGVREECLTDALKMEPKPSGIFGGRTEQERRRMRRR